MLMPHKRSLSTILQELLEINLKIRCYVDCNTLVLNVHSSTNVKEDKRLVLDMCALKEMLENEEISSIDWVEAEGQISDPMTKRGASPKTLQDVLCSGKLRDICVR